ncbi:hypothetical protein PFISCL1PPCAC_11037 [Pristionchus fissidentatus]|uniref:EF-hand domain-containing protein n=1 Tax=Pristionchus fissidentatus TaxID=1538716 RepID=A0AAV5VP29_9BILA|nr:hypothetical protein PFISCL1PPCAC_11037 [Pristionchus fissidentatus]
MSWAGRVLGFGWRRLGASGARMRLLKPATAVATMYTVSSYMRKRKAEAFQLGDADKLTHHVYTDHKLTKRELRFLEYASIEYDDVIYMSPMDFIDSFTRDTPRERIYRRVLKEPEVHKMLGKTPPLRKGGRDLFRSLDQGGLISYADYIFLVTLLTKSKDNFKIAFMMFDDDDSGRVDKEEFLLIRSLMSSLRSTRNAKKQQEDKCQLDMTEFSFVVTHLQDRLFTGSDNYSIAFSKSEEEVKREDTTVLLHLFGKRGRESLTFEDFMVFYDNLQYEVMEIEFREFARGKKKISPVDFALMVLRYTILDREEYAEYIDRVAERTAENQGVTLEQWSSFSIFLNNLAQFSTAVRLYTNADMPVTKAEFARAVQCTCGEKLDDTVVDLIFAVFDANDDGKLSYREFLAVMNDRLHRGLKTRNDRGWTWKDFKRCVINEMSR